VLPYNVRRKHVKAKLQQNKNNDARKGDQAVVVVVSLIHTLSFFFSPFNTHDRHK
jgi:protein-S-isoprenylcysteine O-methyltransferase Ste14